ncbi:recombinase family protein [Mesorhizobium sp. BAC0120]|uniref:recombinase family protein n=1 Tax=Mesorhizobium sp. BAC0120 TaxID=3090670 RepID=UPI00399A14AD
MSVPTRCEPSELHCDRAKMAADNLNPVSLNVIPKRIIVSGNLSHSGIDTTTRSGKLLFGLLASFAEFETALRKERQMEGIESGFRALAAWITVARLFTLCPARAVRRMHDGSDLLGERHGMLCHRKVDCCCERRRLMPSDVRCSGGLMRQRCRRV